MSIWRKLLAIRSRGTADSAQAAEHQTQSSAEGRIDLAAVETLLTSRRERLKRTTSIEWELPLPLLSEDYGLLKVSYEAGQPAIILSITIPDRYGERGLVELAQVAKSKLFDGADMISSGYYNMEGYLWSVFVLKAEDVFG